MLNIPTGDLWAKASHMLSFDLKESLDHRVEPQALGSTAGSN